MEIKTKMNFPILKGTVVRDNARISSILSSYRIEELEVIINKVKEDLDDEEGKNVLSSNSFSYSKTQNSIRITGSILGERELREEKVFKILIKVDVKENSTNWEAIIIRIEKTLRLLMKNVVIPNCIEEFKKNGVNHAMLTRDSVLHKITSQLIPDLTLDILENVTV